jgi:hypothetical protein
MGFIDKAKAAAEQAATRAKETASELQTKRELGQAYDELGRKTFELIEAGEVSSATLDPLVERIRVLTARLDEREPVAAGTTTAEPPSSTGTPA